MSLSSSNGSLDTGNKFPKLVDTAGDGLGPIQTWRCLTLDSKSPTASYTNGFIHLFPSAVHTLIPPGPSWFFLWLPLTEHPPGPGAFIHTNI